MVLSNSRIRKFNPEACEFEMQTLIEDDFLTYDFVLRIDSC